MKDGNWVPMSKAAVKELPIDRPYSKVEALFSIQVDYDNNQEVSVTGYAKLWGWSRDKVRTFISKIGAEIIYPNDTRKIRNQMGTIKKHTYPHKADISPQKNKHIRFADSKALQDSKNIPASEKKHKTGIPPDTTKDPIDPNPKYRCAKRFDSFWKEYPKKRDKQKAFKAFQKINPDEQLLKTIISAVQLQKQSNEWQKKNGQYIPYPTTWLNGERWEDEIESKPSSRFSM